MAITCRSDFIEYPIFPAQRDQDIVLTFSKRWALIQ